MPSTFKIYTKTSIRIQKVWLLQSNAFQEAALLQQIPKEFHCKTLQSSGWKRSRCLITGSRVRTERERRKISVISSTRKDVVTEGEKQEKGRRRGKGEKHLTPLMNRSTNIKKTHKTRPASIPQSYSSVLIFLHLKLKDTQRTANCVHLKQNSGYAGHYHTVERYYPPVTSSCSYQTVFLQGEWGRKEILSGTAQNEEKKDC